MRKAKLSVLVLVLVISSLILGGCLTPKMSYQGKLTDPAGNPVPNGNYNVTFRLWNMGGIPNPVLVWQETQTVAVADGLFNVTLGAVTPMTPSLFVDPLELGVDVNGDGEMTPRQALLGAPYAMSLVDGAVVAGTRNLADDEEYPAMFNVFNAGDSYGIGVLALGKAGVAVSGEWLGSVIGLNGILVDGVETGARITATNGSGVLANSLGGPSDNWWGVRGYGNEDDGGDGGFFWGYGTGNASTGVTGRAEEGRAIYGFTLGAGQYAGYFDDPIYVNGGCTGCSLRYLGRNSSTGTLQPGVAVSASGVETGIAGMAGPVMKVAPSAPGQAVLGIVVGRTTMTVADGSLDDVGAGAQFGPVGGAAAPGDYLVIVVQGPAQVQAAPTANITAGSLLYLGADGVTTVANGPVIGMALDAVDADGLVWVLVGFH